MVFVEIIQSATLTRQEWLYKKQTQYKLLILTP